ncbi:NADPH-cytochrome p450 reductase, putative [Eimeria tenella]|uniref:NADPH--hemoprotein reductase n=1 Tax=Eimeria tenella TaxID=5802 RepID=U6KYH4_EIMTE|nr:NADPH-cytochrome p450 reductase, putative [Eimeria tenella]CDJ41958.1 NADPH-cytochrome p450 reductase, putative [Eimeria tenella]|eukprot:XP_013232708.1 NADPH-cytochrome p450 reductase, putative [Eimeria tenella]
MEPLPLLRSTDLLQQDEDAATAAATAAAAKHPAAAAAAAADSDCRELEFDVSAAPGLRCHTADTLYVLPRNSNEEVLWWFDFLGFKKRGIDLKDEIHFLEETVPFPTPCTVEDALALYCSFELPSRAELSVFGCFAEEQQQRRQWLRLTTDPTQGDTFAAAVRGQGWCLRGLLAVLLPSLNLAAANLGLLLLLLSRGRMPRAYTLASSHLQQPQQQQQQQQQQQVTRTACICLNRHSSPRRDPQQLLLLLQQHGIRPFAAAAAIPSGTHHGVCSSYLLNLRAPQGGPPPEGAPPLEGPPTPQGGPPPEGPPNPQGGPLGASVSVLCCCKPSCFKLPADEDTPLLLVAAGTGVAPFAAFVRHLAAVGAPRAAAHLFFGCTDTRHFLYKDLFLSHLDWQQQQQPEVQQLLEQYLRKQKQKQQQQQQHVLSRIFLALSRVNPERKVYVQHKIAEEGELVWGLLQSGAAVYVCGKPAMGEAVQAALVSVAAAHVGQKKAEAFIQRMHDTGRYIKELWD